MSFLSKKIAILFLAVSALLNSNAQKQILLDPALQSNSERWVAKEVKKRPRIFFQFGPYNVLQIEKIDSPRLAKEKGKFFELRPLIGINKSSEWQKFYQLTAVYNQDTALINLTISLTSVTHTPGFFSKKDEQVETNIDSLFVRMLIATDTIPWLMNVGRFGINSSIEGSLTHGADEYKIEGIDYIAGKNNMPALGPFPKGIRIKNKNEEELAALQLIQKHYAWLKKGLPGDLAFAMAVSLSLILTGNSRPIQLVN